MKTTRDGYAFPLALAAIVIIALIVTVASDQVRQSNAALIRLDARIETAGIARSAEQTFLYHMLTNPIGRSGIEVGGVTGIAQSFQSAAPVGEIELIPANGTALTFESVVLRYYDEQSFMNLATRNQVVAEIYLSILGVPRNRHARLIAAMNDYQDEDDLPLLGGAEAFSYDQEGMPPNRPILSPLEVCNVAGWSELELCDDIGRLLLLSEARVSDQLNIQLVGIPVLQSLVGDLDDARLAHAAIAAGTLQQFADIGHPALDVPRDVTTIAGGPTAHFVLVTQNREATEVWRTAFQLTPQSVIAPFSILDRYRIGGDYVRDTLKVGPDEFVQPLPEAGGEPRTP